ncbi:hypothetical protein, partial [Staphylococcus pasteuri]|uniref:hypothetical protein n=1 Tax=Staphylococcus pasteuri TaxID=45972 RepID=UPI001649F96B
LVSDCTIGVACEGNWVGNEIVGMVLGCVGGGGGCGNKNSGIKDELIMIGIRVYNNGVIMMRKSRIAKRTIVSSGACT